MNLTTSSLRSFTSRLVQLISQKATFSGHQKHLIGTQINAVETQPRLRGAVQSTTSVQFALMQRMGVKGRAFMEACKRRSISI